MQNDAVKLEKPHVERRSSAHLGNRSTEAPSAGKTQRDRERIRNRVASAIAELHNLQDLLATEDVDSRLLTDFRDALNRTRNTAWGVQQYLSCRSMEADSTTLMQVLAVERIRVAYQLGQALLQDLQAADLKLQPAQLVELYTVMKGLTSRLGKLVG
jgi:hypothetical protein